MLGAPLSKLGGRSPHVTSVRATPPPDNKTPATGSSRTPLQKIDSGWNHYAFWAALLSGASLRACPMHPIRWPNHELA